MQTEFAESADLTLTNNGLRERITQRLTQNWRDHRVDSSFQAIFLESLREASISQFSEMANTEIELTSVRQSFAFSLQLAEQARSDALRRLARGVEELEGRSSKTERDIDQLCRWLQELREANLHAAELMLDVDRYFRDALRQNCYSPALAKEMRRLDEDNHFLRRSLLRKFILFSKSFDPFLLKHQEALKATQNQRLREIKSVEVMFTLPISFVYRLEKAQRGCLDYLGRGATSGGKEVKNFRIISPVREGLKSKKNRYFSSPKEEPLDELEASSAKLDEELSSFRLDRDVYLSNRRATDGSNDYQSLPRKGSDCLVEPPSPSMRIRNNSMRSTKETQLLPRLNTIHSTSHRDSKLGTTSTSKRYNAHRSINQMEERDLQLRNLILPKKFQKLEAKTTASKQLIIDRREISIQCDPPKVRPASISPTYQQESIQTLQNRSPPPPSPPAKQESSPLRSRREQSQRSKYKKYQLKASSIPIGKFMESFKALNFNRNYSRILEVGSWENSITHNQYYFHKFFVDGVMSAVALSCALPEGDVLIKCWGPLEGCDGEMSRFLFGKYIEHIQKTTFCATIFYNNLGIDELAEHGFVRQKERIYQRTRVYPSLCEKGDYAPFLVLNFTSAAISKQTPSQEGLLVRANIDEYHPGRFICFNYLLIINKLMQSGSFSTVAAYRPRLPSVHETATAILSQNLSPDAYDQGFRCNYVHLLTLRLRNPIKYAFFLADKGYIKLYGEVVDEDEEFVIIALPFLRHNTRMYFGKGIKSAAEMAERCKAAGGIGGPKSSKEPQKTSFSVRMFRRRLRGRMMGVNLKEENTYGDFQLTFSWRDFLKGKIQHDVTQAEDVFDGSFYCLLEMERELLFVFDVTPKDFFTPPE